jgi:putative selenium metabolism protein SsnA
MLLITNATLVTWEEPNRILEHQALLVGGGRIQEIGPSSKLEIIHRGAQKLDAHGQFLMPGNICAHTHFYGAFARGMAIPGEAPAEFTQILEKLWWSLDKALTLDDVRFSALVMLADAIRHGATTLIDHHASPNAIEGSLDVIAEAVDQSGLRAVLCYEVTDRDGSERALQGIEENVRFIQRSNQEEIAGGRVAATFGLHASLTLSDKTLEKCRAAAPVESGFHLHVAEGIADQYDSLKKSGLRVVDRLHRHGLLGPRSIAAHAVHVDAREVTLLAETGTWVTHQPRSNMNNAVGVADVESLLRAGVPVCLGTDGFSSTMWTEARFAYLLQKAWHGDPRRMPGDDVMRIAVRNNAWLAGQFFQDAPLGVLTPGAHADLILVDYHPFTPLSVENLPWHILFGFQDSMVTTTIVAGEVVMLDRKLITLDEAEIAARARTLAPAVWRRFHQGSSQNRSEVF